MKKYLLSLFVISTFVIYAIVFHNKNSSVANVGNAVTSSTPIDNNPLADTATNPTTTDSPAPQPTANNSTTSSGSYKNGQFTGSSADAFYGNVQVQLTIKSSKITDVRFLDYPHDRQTSQMINNQAMPILKSEVIKVQSANIDAVTGATATSQAFLQSLDSALSQAKV